MRTLFVLSDTLGLKERKKEECRSFFKVGVNEMPIRPTHDDMSIGHAISGARLLTPYRVDKVSK